jgi:hypothetical protein
MKGITLPHIPLGYTNFLQRHFVRCVFAASAARFSQFHRTAKGCFLIFFGNLLRIG